MNANRLWLLCVVLVQAACVGARPGPEQHSKVPELFNSSFRASEGISFSGTGELYVGANRGIWKLSPDGTATHLTDVYTHLGQAGIGDQDILAADFGPTNIFSDKDAALNDGIIWRLAPSGEKRAVARGIADPNFIVVLPDKSYLVSDDGTDKIYHVTPQGKVTIWSDAIDYPNGMVLSLDHSKLYVAQIFQALDPVVPDDRLWEIPLVDYRPSGPPRLASHTGGTALDGLALDERGRVYIADNGGGRILRFDPVTEEVSVVAEGIPHAASIVFGEGAFDHYSLYVTSTFKGGGRIWRVPVGVKGAALIR